MSDKTLDVDKYLDPGEEKQLMEYTQDKCLVDLAKGRTFYVRAWMVLDFLLDTGCRATEARLLKICDINLKSKIVEVVGKGGKKRKVEITPDLVKHIKKYLKWKRTINESTDPDSHFFLNRLGKSYTLQGFQNVFKKLRDEAGLRNNYTIHCTRHTYGFNLYRTKKDLRMVQRQLGHSSPSITAIYSHYDPVELTEALKNLRGATR